eukprot:TRINITY_DN56001_c0_g1_i1.p1 TRINITY_DN56001_c0_g1~~TRINITY_DN56001_c0_g1_i1.p1  ORF type:complete len:550 (+),score=96.48 TRINITY_DN56001_c0_g1_i1:107-1756(+)
MPSRMHATSGFYFEDAAVPNDASTAPEASRDNSVNASYRGRYADGPFVTKSTARHSRQALDDITNLQASHMQAPLESAGNVCSHAVGPKREHRSDVNIEKRSNVFSWREAPCVDELSDALVVLDGAISAVVESVCDGRSDEEWTRCLSLKLLELIWAPAVPLELVGVLKKHGWWTTQFASSPDREMLLQDLEELRAELAVALPTLADSFKLGQEQIPQFLGCMAVLPSMDGLSWLGSADHQTTPGDADLSWSEVETLGVVAESSSREASECASFGEAPSFISFCHKDEQTEDLTEDRQHINAYGPDIIANMLRLETVQMPRPNYMERQPSVNADMRAVLIDWLVDVMVRFNLRRGTLFLAVSLIDQYLSQTVVACDRLQLVGTTAAFIASKFEDNMPPAANDFCYVTAGACKVEELFVMESAILNFVNFNVAVPTAAFFLDYYCSINGCDPAHRETIQYLAELALLDMRILSYRPSQLAAAAVLLGNRLVGKSDVWPREMAAQAPYDQKSLDDCAAWLLGLLDAAPTQRLHAVRGKFSSKKHFEVATMH